MTMHVHVADSGILRPIGGKGGKEIKINDAYISNDMTKYKEDYEQTYLPD